LNPSNSSLKAIIFRASGSVICKMLVNSSWEAVLIFMVLGPVFTEVGEMGKKSILAILYNCRVLSKLYLLSIGLQIDSEISRLFPDHR